MKFKHALRFFIAGLGVCIATASAQDFVKERVPSWMHFTGEVRLREEGFLGQGFREGADDMYLLQRFRLGLQVQPAPWLKGFVQGQDARVSFTGLASPTPHQDSADLRQAWIQFGDAATHHVEIRAGRQELAFGEERLVGASNWGNISRTFDALRVGFQSGGYRVDAFASSVVAPKDHVLDSHAPGEALAGLYGDISSWVPHAKVQPYFLWSRTRSVLGESGASGRQHTDTIGVRWAGDLPMGLLYTMELAFQTGRWAGDRTRAWAGFWRIGHEFSELPLRPGLRLEVNHASGDSDPSDGRHGTFNVLYPTAHDKYGLTDQVGWKNINHIGLIAEAKPVRDLVLQLKFHDWWLASARDGLYNAGGALLVRDPTGSAGTHVGEEVSFQALWAVSPHFQLGGGLGHLFPGGFLEHTTPGHGYTFPYVSLTYGF